MRAPTRSRRRATRRQIAVTPGLRSIPMEIIGLGIDLADVARVRKLLNKNPDAFRRRCFTDREWEYAQRFADPSERLAARFAGKEAVMKRDRKSVV